MIVGGMVDETRMKGEPCAEDSAKLADAELAEQRVEVEAHGNGLAGDAE